MRNSFIAAMRAGAFGITSVMGEVMDFTLRDGRILRINAVFRPKSTKIAVGDDGIETVLKVPELSIQRASLLACGFADDDLDTVIRGATFSAAGRDYRVEQVEDDETLFVRSWPVLVKSGGYVSPYARGE